MTIVESPAPLPHSHRPPGRPPRTDASKERAPAEKRARTPAGMPPTALSGYEQILVARARLRAEADQAAAAEWREFAARLPAPAPPVKRDAVPPLRRAQGRRFGLIGSGLAAAVAPPACALLALAWFGSPWSPPALPNRPAQLVRPSPSVFGAVATAPGAEEERKPRESGAAMPRGGAPAPPVANDDGPAFAERDVPSPAAPEPDAPQDSAPPLLPSSHADNGLGLPFAEEEPLTAALGQDGLPWTADAGAGDRRHGESEAEEPVPPIAAASGPNGEPGRDGSEPEAIARTAPEDAMPTDPAVADAREPPAGGTAAPAPTVAGLPDQERPLAVDVAVATLGESTPGSASAPAPARPDTATDAAPSAPGPAFVVGAVADAARMNPGGPAAELPRRQEAAAALAPPPPVPVYGLPEHRAPAKARPGATSPLVVRTVEKGAPPATARCRSIVIKAQLGEETSHADRSYLQTACATRR